MITRSFAWGFRLVLRSPGIVVLLWTVNAAAALVPATMIGVSIHESVASSRVHENLEEGFDMLWFGEYEDDARGMERTFTPTLAGAGAPLWNVEAWATGVPFTGLPLDMIGLGVLYLLVWVLLQGGVLDRFAMAEETFRPARFLESAGRFFFRFLRLAIFSWIAYAGIYLLSRLLYRHVGEITRDVTAERPILLLSLLVLGGTAFLLALVHVGFAYAKISTVLQNRRSMILASLAGIGFVLRNPVKTLGLFLSWFVVALALVVVYAAIAPAAGPASPIGMLLAFAGAQLFLVARLVARLSLLAGQMALYKEVKARRTPLSPELGRVGS